MSRRMSSRLAAKDPVTTISDKENSPQDLPKSTPVSTTVKGSGVNKKKVGLGKRTITTKEKSTSKNTQITSPSTGKSEPAHEKKDEATLPVKGSKRKRVSPAPKIEEEDDELPHNMGKRAPAKPKVNGGSIEKPAASPKPTPAKRSAKKEEQVQEAKEVLEGIEEPPKKKAKKAKANPYGLTPGESPFPDWPHPTPEEAQTVHDLLLSTIEPDRRKRFFPPDNIPAPSEVVAGCGEVPSILDALIRTLLSAATNGQNSSNAFQGLVKRFGLAKSGLGAGSVDWNAVHQASPADVFETIKCGGLALTKSKNIKKILAMVHAENQARLADLLKTEKEGAPQNEDDEEKAERALELHALQQGNLTLDYYHHLSKEDALTTFSAYPGIGVKTAACVSLFCMQRPCFAVDTHVFRLCQYLGWVPPETAPTDTGTKPKSHKKVDRNTTFSHCEVRIPDELKYGLHQLFLEHGKKCPRCRAVTGEKSEGWKEANCVIEHLVKRLGAKKGGIDSSRKKVTKLKKGKKDADSDDEDENASEGASSAAEGEEDAASAEIPDSQQRKTTTPKKAAKAAKGERKTKAAKAKGKKSDAKASSRKKNKDVSEESEDEDEEMADLSD